MPQAEPLRGWLLKQEWPLKASSWALLWVSEVLLFSGISSGQREERKQSQWVLPH